MGPEIAIKWGTRLLYVEIFIVLFMALGSFDNPRVFTWIGGIVCLCVTALFFVKEE